MCIRAAWRKHDGFDFMLVPNGGYHIAFIPLATRDQWGRRSNYAVEIKFVCRLISIPEMSSNRAQSASACSSSSAGESMNSMRNLRKQRSFAVDNINLQSGLSEKRLIGGGRVTARSALRKQASEDRSTTQRERFSLHRQHSLVAAGQRSGNGDSLNVDGDSDLRIFAAITKRRPSAGDGIECVYFKYLWFYFVSSVY